MCTPPYLLLPNGWQNRFLFSLHSFLLQKSLHSRGLQLPSPPLGFKYFRSPREVFHWVISSDLLPLNDPDTPTLLHRSSPDISFAPSSLAPGGCFRTWVLTPYQSFYLSLSLSQAYRPNKRPPSFNFQKARWNGFASYIDSHSPCAKKCSSLSVSSAAALFISLALNAANFSIPFRPHQMPS